MKAVILVPRRADRGWRDTVWEWIRAWWEREQSHMPIFEGHHDSGLFNRSAAVNRAASLAGDWDVAVIIDSDVICDATRVKEAVTVAHATGKVVYPHDVRKDLDGRGTRKVMAGFTGSWDRFVYTRYPNMVSSVVVVPRRLWDEIGGFDESFEGWGYEDTAFAAAADTFGDGHVRMEGEVWHFWHPTAKEGKVGTPVWSINSSKGQRYRAAIGDREAIRALQDEKRQGPAPEATTGIPKILHRVVPEQTPEVAEQWWREFADMHPDWHLMTHRDPLDAKEFPLTSPFWKRAANGAQLADLVRLEALLKWGGVYVDQDVRPIRPLDPLLGVPAFAAWEDARVVPNAVMGAVPNHPAIKRCLELARERMTKGTWEAGPGVTTEVLVGRPDVLVLPPETFYPVHYRDPRRDEKMADFDPAAHPWTFAVHGYWGSWLEPSRRRVPA